ncbi:MAG: hypothetical protein JW726_03000 [Anaerolineales bacterium]|nr:hypothetical protein [Anaerolineales bacterium]
MINSSLPNSQFIIQNYQSRRPFASFLPGIAGPLGIPMWVFYVNRGQAIASFGVESKDHPILEYQPANKAYQTTGLTGFRTFIKVSDGPHPGFYEPFSSMPTESGIQADLHIAANEILLVEESPVHGMQVSVLYFILPGEPFAALVRQLTITNHSDIRINGEMLDGLPVVIPFGVNNFLLKELSRTVEAWMSVICQENMPPFFQLRASVADLTEVKEIQAGHFYLAFNSAGCRLPVLVDPIGVFGQDTALIAPAFFQSTPLSTLIEQPQITIGRTPCAFSASTFSLAPQETFNIYAVIGHVPNMELLADQYPRLLQPGYLEQKRQQATILISSLTSHIATHTSQPLFDAYCAQSFLDNVLRGGWPLLIGNSERKHVYHIYSRRHGDLERDYNAFFLEAAYYSQGNGSYRDINQNRRCDVLLEPGVGKFNVLTFMNLIQADGYNPLIIQGSRFHVPPEQHPALLAMAGHPPALARLLENAFTPGEILRAIEGWPLPMPAEQLLSQIIALAEQHLEAEPGDGYWVDHWTYNLDLIDTYLAIYPERKSDLLYDTQCTYYDNTLIVRPRREKYVLTKAGPRQYHAVVKDAEKQALIGNRIEAPHLARDENGHGRVFSTSLFSKLVCLAVLKFSSLDPAGMGIEMEADRPGWDDAMNGLPALFGSSMPETYELLRLLRFLQAALEEQPNQTHTLPVEVSDLIWELEVHLQAFQESSNLDRDFQYWDACTTARERYRERIRLGFAGDTVVIQATDLKEHLMAFQEKVEIAITRAIEKNGGVPPTYFTYQITEYEFLESTPGNNEDPSHPAKHDDHGYPSIRAKEFQQQRLPLFLEGPVHAMKLCTKPEQARRIYQKVQASDLFDRKLGMYKLNASLSACPAAIGRVHAFPPGWLENESIWLHMAYKYLLEVLRAGLYEEFFTEFRRGLVPFFDPQVYGRSPVENSSFLVSSAHPDESLHGAGFVARLSGSTAEFISIWHQMLVGAQPFYEQEHGLCLRLQPTLPGWLFDSQGLISFHYLGCCDIIYHNPTRRDILPDLEILNFELHTYDGKVIHIPGSTIHAPFAAQIRAEQVKTIHAFFP